MPRPNHRKRAFLFLAAVLLPSAVLVGTTVRLIRQQRELAVRRADEERALLALRIGQELIEDLRRLDDRVAQASFSPQGIFALIDSEPAVLTLALAGDGHLVFPWEVRPDPSSALDPASFARYVRFLERGEQAEYREGDFLGAVRLYGQAAEVFGEASPGEESSPEKTGESSQAASVLLAEAMVHQARALLRAERTAEAQAAFLLLAESPLLLTDMEGMPFSIYGFEGLFRTGTNPRELVRLLGETLDRPPHLSLPAVLAWQDVARGVADGVEEAPAKDLLQLSPDGSELVFGVNDPAHATLGVDPRLHKGGKLMIMPSNGGVARELFVLDGSGRVGRGWWSSDGSTIVFVVRDEDSTTLMRVTPGGGDVERLQEVLGRPAGFGPSPDRSRIAYWIQENEAEIWVMENLVAALRESEGIR
jgi:hypothetical protein